MATEENDNKNLLRFRGYDGSYFSFSDSFTNLGAFFAWCAVPDQTSAVFDIEKREIFVNDLLKVWIEGVLQEDLFIVKDPRVLYFETERDDHYLRFSQVQIVGNSHANPEKAKTAVPLG